MPQNDNTNAKRLYESICKNVKEETANRYAECLPLSKSASLEKKHVWANAVCDVLDSEFDETMVKKIRMDCACGPSAANMKQMRKLYKDSTDLQDFCDRANALQHGYTISTENGELLLHYPQCYCPVVNRIEKTLPKSWCDCSLGYAKRMFEMAMEQEVDTELIESVKTGGKQCIIRIIPGN